MIAWLRLVAAVCLSVGSHASPPPQELMYKDAERSASRSPFLILQDDSAFFFDEREECVLHLLWEGDNLDVEDDDAGEHASIDWKSASGTSMPLRHVLLLVDNVVVYALPVNGSGEETDRLSCHSERPECQPYGRCCGGMLSVSLSCSPSDSDGEHELLLLLSNSAHSHHAVLYKDKSIRTAALISVDSKAQTVTFLKNDGEGGSAAAASAANAAPKEEEEGARERRSSCERDDGRGNGASRGEREPTGAAYSTHKCAGVDMNFHEAWSSNKFATTISHEGGRRALQDGTCLFENVCSLDGILTYVQHVNMSRRTATAVPRLHALSRLWRADPREPCANWEEVAFRVRAGTIPCHYPRTQVPHAYIRRIYPKNAGHVLADDAWSVFQGMLLFDMLGTQFTCFTGTKVQILTRETVVDYDIQIIVDDDRGPLLGAGYWSNKVFGLVSGRPVVGRSWLRGRSICFHRFLTGWGGLGFGSGKNIEFHLREPAVWGKGSMQREFRAHAWRHLLPGSLHPSTPWAYGWKHPVDTNTPGHTFGNTRLMLSMISKGVSSARNKFDLKQTQDFAASLERLVLETLGEALTVRHVTWAGMTVKDQVTVLADTDVLLGLPGSDAINAIFLPDDSLVILPCRLAGGWQSRRKQAQQAKHTSSEWGEVVWESENDSATLWLRHFTSIHVVEWCQHLTHNLVHELKPEFVGGVRLEPQDFVAIIGDWMLMTHRPPRAWKRR